MRFPLRAAAVILVLALPASSALVESLVPAAGEAPDASAPAAASDPEPASEETVAPVQDLPALSTLAREQRLLLGVPVPDWPYEAVHLSWPLGDVDADGAHDILWETYCVDAAGCGQGGVPLVNVAIQELCYEQRHHMQALSGRTGDTLWSQALDGAHPEVPYLPLAGGVGGCVVDSVLGVLDGDVLLYTWRAVQATSAVIEIEHIVTRINGTTGFAEWAWSAPGRYVGTPWGAVADALLAVPILQEPPRQGLDLLGGMSPGLVVRGIGFTRAGGGAAGAYAESVQPQEWAAGVDLETGGQLWRSDTVTPQPERRVVVSSFEARTPFVAPVHSKAGLINHIISYFAGVGCCYDLSGDGVPDLLLGTTESPLTQPSAPGMEDRVGRLMLYDGATGQASWELMVEEGAPSYCGLQVLPLTDVDGDGAHDLLVRAFHGGSSCPAQTPYTVSTVRSGKTADALWSHDTRDQEQSMLLVPLGDVQGDGAHDLLRILVDNAETGRAGVTEFQEISVGAVDGATGDVLWEGASFAAAIDLAIGLSSLLGNGLPDADQDGIADVWLDRLEFLEDQSAVHHLTLVSGGDGKKLHEVPTVGAFAIPLGLRDVTGDGREDHAILQGDADDIWITTYDGQTGRSEWSRRVMSLNATNALINIPLVKMHSLRLDDQGAWDSLLGLTFFTIDLGGGRGTALALTQQHLSLAGEGDLLWGIPTVGEGDASLIRKKPTPAVQAYEEYVEEQEALQEAAGRPSEGPPWAVPAAAAGLALAAGGVTVLLGRRKR